MRDIKDCSDSHSSDSHSGDKHNMGAPAVVSSYELVYTEEAAACLMYEGEDEEGEWEDEEDEDDAVDS